MGDELARQRRELPWVAIEKEYQFDADDGDGAAYQTYATTWRGLEILMTFTRSWIGYRRGATSVMRGKPGFAAMTNTPKASGPASRVVYRLADGADPTGPGDRAR